MFASSRFTRRVSGSRAPRRRLQTVATRTLATPSLLDRLGAMPRPKMIALGGVLVFAAILYAFFDSDYFYVFQFNITGTQFLPSAEVIQASGIRGYNVFFIDARVVERALMQMPEVKSARVLVRLPNDVTMEIVERQPIGVWQRGETTFWVDSEGMLMRARASLPDLPTVRDGDTGTLALGQRAPANAFAAFVALRAAMPESPRALEWSSARGIAFTDERGWKIYLGTAEDMPGKIAILRALVAQLVAQNARIRFIDLGKGTPYYQ
ncbi:MAG: FtsQ-type POTRA domain-containing protein [Anaerolineae bacterium]|nr:FtsQ-type POTRA domain-containing protein [Anaerolineae bacterium]